jgi:hypothetical protein
MKRRPLLCLIFFILFFLGTKGFSAEPYNLWVSGLYTDRKDVAPGDMINVTYLLQANAALFGRLDMGIFIRSGANGIWAAEWSIPHSEGANMGSGRTLTKTMQVRIPDWGGGTYFISITANKSHFLAESNYDDNSMEVPVNVQRGDSTTKSKYSPFMGELGKYPFDKQCGENILSVILDRDRVLPGANLTITARWIRQLTVIPDIRVDMNTDGGQFTENGGLEFVGVTNQDGSTQTEWQAPSYPATGSGEVRYTLYVLVRTSSSTGKDLACSNRIPLLVKW